MSSPRSYRRLFVTGGQGFVGQAIGNVVSDETSYSGIELLENSSEFELTDINTINEALLVACPDLVIHLAAQSFVPRSFDDPEETYDVNFYGTLNLLTSLKAHGFKGRFLFVGTGDSYGLVNEEDLPVCEELPLKPRNPYAVSKVAAESLCYQWSQTEDFDIIMARPFNHIGPCQSDYFVVSDFAKQVVEIKLGRKSPHVHVGDIEVSRDFTDVRDVVRAYFLMLADGDNGEAYNVCSGREFKISEILTELIRISGVEIEVVVDKSRLRKSEQRRVVGSNDKLRNCTGWQPEYDLIGSLTDILNDWERKLTNE